MQAPSSTDMMLVVFSSQFICKASVPFAKVFALTDSIAVNEEA